MSEALTRPRRIPKNGTRPNDRQRVDKWLWHARIVRTRSDAAALAHSGYVRLNGQRITAPGQPVRIGDVLTLALDRAVRVLRVVGFCDRRGASAAARALYHELTRSDGAGDSPEAMPKRLAE